MGFAIQVHRDWKREPSVLIRFAQLPRGDHLTDRYASYITGEAVDGKRYIRTVETTGRVWKLAMQNASCSGFYRSWFVMVLRSACQLWMAAIIPARQNSLRFEKGRRRVRR